MKLFYYRSREGNFGDDLNGWLWEELLPGAWSDNDDVLFSGIGTVIGNPMPHARKIIVFSSGIGYSPVPSDLHDRRWQIVALRGPLTAEVLGCKPDAAVADGALLLTQLPRFAALPDRLRSGIVFVPHHAALTDPGWARASNLAGIELLDPRGDSERVILRLRSAKLVIADSMHAAIIADAMRVPWVPVISSSHINTFKWLDWSMTVGVPYEPTWLPAPSISSVYRSWSQGYYGHAFTVAPPTAATAIAHFRKAVQYLNNPANAARHHRTKRYFELIGQQTGRLPLASRLGDVVDQRKVERLAEVLSQQGQRTGYLSDHTKILELAGELRARLERVRESIT